VAQVQTDQPVHSLIVPTANMPILVPSASIAEVVNVSELVSLPLTPDWCLGVIGWRQRAVPVVSFEALMGNPAQRPAPRSKIIIFFPIPGRKDFEFFGVLSSSEPQPHTVSPDEGLVTAQVDSPIIAAALELGGVTVGVPDYQVLQSAFYPDNGL